MSHFCMCIPLDFLNHKDSLSAQTVCDFSRKSSWTHTRNSHNEANREIIKTENIFFSLSCQNMLQWWHIFLMQTKDDLIRENAELRARLELAEQWMQREVQTAMRHIQKKEVQSVTRKHFSNLLEEEGIDIIARRIHDTFGDGLAHAPGYTLERLIDAEIYWQTLQKYPTMDGLPIVLAYQKILDAWVEEKLISVWRKNNK